MAGGARLVYRMGDGGLGLGSASVRGVPYDGFTSLMLRVREERMP